MEKYFKKETGERVNVIDHCQEVLGKYPNAKVLIGCDSQNSKFFSKYSIAIVFRYDFSGAHYIYQNIKVPKIKDLFSRLFKECELSLEVAEYISQNTSYKVEAIELDFNDFKVTKSTPLISATKGWCESLGYNVILKSGEMIATKAADKHCRNKSKRKE